MYQVRSLLRTTSRRATYCNKKQTFVVAYKARASRMRPVQGMALPQPGLRNRRRQVRVSSVLWSTTKGLLWLALGFSLGAQLVQQRSGGVPAGRSVLPTSNAMTQRAEIAHFGASGATAGEQSHAYSSRSQVDTEHSATLTTSAFPGYAQVRMTRKRHHGEVGSPGAQQRGAWRCDDCTTRASMPNCLELCRRHVGRDGSAPAALAGTPTDHPILSVYLSILGPNEERYFDGYARDVLLQQVGAPWELVVASASNTALATFRDVFDTAFEVAVERGGHGELGVLRTAPALTTLTMQADEGLYETWDLLIRNYTRGTYLCNWNIDDRKHPQALAKKIAVLARSPKIDVVSSSVIVSNKPNEDWETVMTKSEPDVWFRHAGFYGLSKLVKTSATTGELIGPENYPHNSPVYRRSVHKRADFFKAPRILGAHAVGSSAPPCSDWALWSSLARSGGQFWNIPEPLEVYYLRSDSHNRRDQSVSDKCVETVLSHLKPLGLFNNDYYRWRKHASPIALVVDEMAPIKTTGSGVRMRQLLEWLVHNGAQVTLVVREHFYHAPSQIEAEDWLAEHGIEFYVDSMEMGALKKRLLGGEHFDLILLALRFWHEHKSSTMASVIDPTAPELVIEMFDLPASQRPGLMAVLSDELHWRRCAAMGESMCSQLAQIRKREADIYSASDVVVSVDARDADQATALVAEQTPGSRPIWTIVAPMTISIDASAVQVLNARTRNAKGASFLYIGSPSAANVRTVRLLLHEIFPKVRQRMPSARLVLVGAQEWLDLAHEAENALPDIYKPSSGRSTSVQRACDADGACRLKPCGDMPWGEGCSEMLAAYGPLLNVAPILSEAGILIEPAMAGDSGISTKVFFGIENGMHVVTTPAGAKGFLCDRTSRQPWCEGSLTVASKKSVSAMVAAMEQAAKASQGAGGELFAVLQAADIHASRAVWVRDKMLPALLQGADN